MPSPSCFHYPKGIHKAVASNLLPHTSPPLIHPCSTHSAGIRSNLRLRALALLLSDKCVPHASLSGLARGLRLLSLLLAVARRLLVLARLDGGVARGRTGFGALCAALLDHVQRGTDDATLRLDGAARALLGDFLRGCQISHHPCYGWTYVRTSEIPFLCCLRKRMVHAMRRGFLRCRKRDSDLPFWKRKILLSPRT